MCDANSLGSALGSIGAGFADSIDTRSRGDFQAMQLETMGVLASAQASDQQGALIRSFTEQARRNIAAIAITGLSQVSFKGVTQGNDADLRRNLAQIGVNADAKKRDLHSRALMAQVDASMKASAALFNGFMAAGNTALDAAKSYQDNQTGQSVGEYFKYSLGFGAGGSFFRKG